MHVQRVAERLAVIIRDRATEVQLQNSVAFHIGRHGHDWQSSVGEPCILYWGRAVLSSMGEGWGDVDRKCAWVVLVGDDVTVTLFATEISYPA